MAAPQIVIPQPQNAPAMNAQLNFLKEMRKGAEERVRRFQLLAWSIISYHVAFQGVVVCVVSNSSKLKCDDTKLVAAISGITGLFTLLFLFLTLERYVRVGYFLEAVSTRYLQLVRQAGLDLAGIDFSTHPYDFPEIWKCAPVVTLGFFLSAITGLLLYSQTQLCHE